MRGTYTYDPLGRRRSKDVPGDGVTTFLLDGDEEIAEYLGGTHSIRYVYGPSIDDRVAMYTYNTSGAQTGVYYYHTDRLGSTIAMTDASGTVSESHAYSPYGEEVNAPPPQPGGNPYRFTGRRLDSETGLYYYRARYYSPALGRFLQTDPIGYADQMNLYAYVYNDPINFRDPSGLGGFATTNDSSWAGRVVDYAVDAVVGALAGPSTISGPVGGIRRYVFGGGQDSQYAFDNIDTGGVTASQFSAAPNFSARATVGHVILRVEGSLRVSGDGRYNFSGNLRARQDRYDFNPSGHRTLVGEASTWVGREIPSKEYNIEIVGGRPISESGIYQPQ